MSCCVQFALIFLIQLNVRKKLIVKSALYLDCCGVYGSDLNAFHLFDFMVMNSKEVCKLM